MITYAVTDPHNGQQVQSYPTATDADVEAALAATTAASQGWARETTVADRAAAMKRAAQLMTEREDELAAIIEREMGKPEGECREEVEFSAAILEYYADNGPGFLADEPIELLAGEGSALIRRAPLGPLLGIMPWNFPYYQVARFAGPNLVAGNTIVLKHAPQCPESALALEKLFRDAGFPEGAYVNLFATHEQCEQMIGDSRIRGVSFTGSERAGAAIAEIAGRNLKKVVCELGGSDPFILLSTDDMDAAAQAAVDARAYNTGQACNAGKRFIVVADLYDDFVAAFSEKLFATSWATPLSSAGAKQNLESQVASAVQSGATFTAAPDSDVDPSGAYSAAGILTNVTKDNPVFHQELFGPVGMVFKVADEREAIELANDTPFGLGSYVFTTDREQAERVADALEVGMVFINCAGADGVELPFGGVKRSGFGRELGRYGIEEFLNKKLLRIA